MVAVGLTRCNDGHRTPCRLANQKEVCYSNAVLQCFAKLIDPSYLGLKLGITHLQNHGILCTRLDVTSTPEVDKRVQETDVRHIDPAADFVRIVKLMQKGPANVVHADTGSLKRMFRMPRTGDCVWILTERLILLRISRQ
jgi:hypothetical protein